MYLEKSPQNIDSRVAAEMGQHFLLEFLIAFFLRSVEPDKWQGGYCPKKVLVKDL